MRFYSETSGNSRFNREFPEMQNFEYQEQVRHFLSFIFSRLDAPSRANEIEKCVESERRVFQFDTRTTLRGRETRARHQNQKKTKNAPCSSESI